MSGILKVGGSELINDNGGSGSLQWGSGVPAGTSIQSKIFFYKAVQNQTASTSFEPTNVTVDIDPKYTGSKMIIRFSLAYGISSASTAGVRIYRLIGGTSTGLSISTGGTYNTGTGMYPDSDNYTGHNYIISGMDEDTSQSQATHTYTVYFGTSNSVTRRINGRTYETTTPAQGTISSIEVTEVKQ